MLSDLNHISDEENYTAEQPSGSNFLTGMKQIPIKPTIKSIPIQPTIKPIPIQPTIEPIPIQPTIEPIPIRIQLFTVTI
jgi:hypothetical protein